MDIADMQERLRDFAHERGWERYHTPKNLTMALAGEAAELMEIFQWLTECEAIDIVESEQRMEDVRDELADVASYLFRLADVLDVDLHAAMLRKIEKNAVKYPRSSPGN